MTSRPARSSSWARATMGPRTAYCASRTEDATSSIRTIRVGYATRSRPSSGPLQLQPPVVDQAADRLDVAVEDPVLRQVGDLGPDPRVRLGHLARGAERGAEVQGLRRDEELDGEAGPNVLDDLAGLERCGHPHRDVVLPPGRRRDRVDRRGVA